MKLILLLYGDLAEMQDFLSLGDFFYLSSISSCSVSILEVGHMTAKLQEYKLRNCSEEVDERISKEVGVARSGETK